MSKDLLQLSIKDIHKKLVSQEVSVREITNTFIAHIQDADPDIHAYLNYHFDEALHDAKKIDEMIKRGDKISLLTGIPFAVKDNIFIEGKRTTAASKILEQYIAPYDAHVIEKLKQQNSVCLGKTNMDEFAMGSSTENSAFAPTKNPADLSRVPGGSSGGSAAAVASHQAIFALGSDTGGSIRQPASFCGVVGMKPTYGAVSRYGLIEMASSLDQIGPLANSVEDTKIIFDAISGKDVRDATSVTHHSSKQNISSLKGLKIGIPKEYFDKGIDAKVKKTIEEALTHMEREGAHLIDVSLPHTSYAISVYYILMPAEASSNLSRYDGIRYGYSTHASSLHDPLSSVYFKSRTQGFGKEVKRRIMLGTYVLSAGYYDAYYKKAQQVRTKIVEDFKKVFMQVDVIATPTTPTVAFSFGEKTKDPLSMYMQDIFTVPANLAGVPALSMPCGNADGMPVGLQFIAPWFDEETLFRVGMEFEKI